MALSLHAATVPGWLQILSSLAGIVDKAEHFCAEHGLDPETLIQARLADDMLPFAYQVKSASVHSIGAIEGVRAGTFSPDMTTPPETFAALRDQITATLASVEALTPDEVESFIGRDMRFVFGTNAIDFFAEDFLLSFSHPNFYFHATTAYDILRARGVPLRKRDFLGRIRTKP